MPTCLSKFLVKASPLGHIKTARYGGFLALKAKSTPGAHPSALCLQPADTQGWLQIWGARGKRAAKIEILNIF
jgi:hypothetical protein